MTDDQRKYCNLQVGFNYEKDNRLRVFDVNIVKNCDCKVKFISKGERYTTPSFVLTALKCNGQTPLVLERYQIHTKMYASKFNHLVEPEEILFISEFDVRGDYE
jgi:hypothetical protein